MIKIICTIGPKTYKNKIIQQLKKNKVDIYRINLSHTTIEDLHKRLFFFKKNKIKNICIDTEGAQIRTTIIKKQFLKKNTIVVFNNLKINKKKLSYGLYPEFDFSQIKKNSIVHIGFESLSAKVMKVNKNSIICKIIESGIIESNKGVHFCNQIIKLPYLTTKDIKAIKIAKELGVKFFALSFANLPDDVEKFRKLIGNKNKLITKIETYLALKNSLKIIKKSDAVLIDRGDLSRYIPIEQIPIEQIKIINLGKKVNKPVYIATNLLETMVNSKYASRAESNDIFSCLAQGASGLVLAAETAIGKYPVECVKFIKKCIKIYLNYKINL